LSRLQKLQLPNLNAKKTNKNSAMKKLQELTSLCKGSVTVRLNEHRGGYQSPLEYLREAFIDETQDVAPEVLEEIERSGQLVEIQFYPNSPVGFHLVKHYDLEKAIDEALATITP
jgi:hypothetical protein